MMALVRLEAHEAGHLLMAIRSYRRTKGDEADCLHDVEQFAIETLRNVANRQEPPQPATRPSRPQNEQPVTTPTDTEWLTITQATQRTGLSRRTIERCVQGGALPSSKVGRARRIHRDDLNRWMQSA